MLKTSSTSSPHQRPSVRSARPRRSSIGRVPTWSGPISRRVVIAHGWADDPAQGWIAWLVDQLSDRGIEATAPAFPEPKRPDIGAWMETFRQSIGQPNDGLVLVGHSLGCLIVLRYLSDLDPAVKITGIVLVAGMAEIAGWDPPGFFEPPLDFAKIKQIAGRRICLYSDDDDKVAPERTKALAELLDAELILDVGQGHFAGLHGTSELPSALEAVERCFSGDILRA